MHTAHLMFAVFIVKIHFIDSSEVPTYGSGKYRADYKSYKCVKDCIENGPLDSDGLCGGLVEGPWVELYESLEECCNKDLYWLKTCLADSLGTTFYTDKYYVHPKQGNTRCAKDCAPSKGLPCMGNPPDDSGFPPALFDTPEQCCEEKVWWDPECVALSSTPLPSSSPTKYPTNYPITSPTNHPTYNPTSSPIELCVVDSDCFQVCETVSKQCVDPDPTLSPTTEPTSSPTLCECHTPKIYPDKCEVNLLIEALDLFASSDHKLLPQWINAAFHDAGTFNTNLSQGGANGCLLNHQPMRNVPANDFLDAPINTLLNIKDFLNNHAHTCVDVSSADILQFAAFFAALRQTGTPGLTTEKRNRLIAEFEWGRPDESSCDTTWTENLPTFRNGLVGADIPTRCTAAGTEIRSKLMARNGFTAQEATALIGAHSIGSTRNTFGASFAGSWVSNGADNATPEGPVMDNSYHNFLVNSIVENNAIDFSARIDPFDLIFPGWFREDDEGLNYLDTDIALAFPSLDTGAHPSFNTFSQAFAGDNDFFLDNFFLALDKMSKLGITNETVLEAASQCGCLADIRMQVEASTSTPPGELIPDEFHELSSKLGNSTSFADVADTEIQHSRIDETYALTTPAVLG